MFCKHKPTKINSLKYCYISLKIQLNISHLFTQLNDQRVLFRTIQFGICHFFALKLNVKQFYLSHRKDPLRCCQTWSGWTWEQWREAVLHIPQNSRFTGVSLSDYLILYLGQLLWGFYPSAEMQSVYSTAPVDGAFLKLILYSQPCLTSP